MKSMYELKELLCDELDEIARKGELGAGDLDIVHKLTDTIKNIDKIDMLEDTGYSGAGDWEADMRGHYGHGKHYVRAHYSRTGAKERMMEEMRAYMRDADDERTREAIKRCVDTLGSL